MHAINAQEHEVVAIERETSNSEAFIEPFLLQDWKKSDQGWARLRCLGCDWEKEIRDKWWRARWWGGKERGSRRGYRYFHYWFGGQLGCYQTILKTILALMLSQIKWGILQRTI